MARNRALTDGRTDEEETAPTLDLYTVLPPLFALAFVCPPSSKFTENFGFRRLQRVLSRDVRGFLLTKESKGCAVQGWRRSVDHTESTRQTLPLSAYF